MNVTQRIAKNTAVLIAAEVVTAVINLFFMMYVARYLGAEGFGVLSLALAFTAIFSVLTDVGLNQLMTREVARDKNLASKYLPNIINLKTVLTAVTFGLIALTINLLGYPPQTRLVILITSGFLAANTFNTTFYSIFQAYEKMEFVTTGRAMNAILLLVGALIAMNQTSGNAVTFAMVYLFASAITVGFNTIISVWRFTKPRFEIDLAFCTKTLGQAWPFGLSGIFNGIYFWIGSVMLSLMKGDEVVGWFNAAYRLVFSLGIVPSVYFSAAFPVMSKFYITSQESLKLINEKSIKYMSIIALPMAVGTSLLANKVITLIFGAGYENSVIALQLLVWGVAFVFISSGFARLFESLNRQLIVTIVAAACAFINVGLNLILIPTFSYQGASIATVVTEFGAVATLLVWSSKIGYSVSWKKILDYLARTLVASAAMGVFVFYLRDLTLWVLIPISALLYFVVLFIIKGIDSEDRVLLKQMIHRRPAAKESAIN